MGFQMQIVKPKSWDVNFDDDKPSLLCIYGGLPSDIIKILGTLNSSELIDKNILIEFCHHDQHHDRHHDIYHRRYSVLPKVPSRGLRLEDSTLVKVSNNIKVRKEQGFFLVYNGKHAIIVNKMGIKILNKLKKVKSISELCAETKISKDSLLKFLYECFIFRIIDVINNA